MLSRALVWLFFLLCLAPVAHAQATLTFPSAGEHWVWTSAKRFDAEPTGYVKTGETTLSYPGTGAKDTDLLHVLDAKSGLVAIRPWAAAQKNPTFQPGDFSVRYKTVVRVVSGEKAVAAASVNISAGKEARQALLDPSLDGNATFFGLPQGKASVEVQVNSAGKPTTIRQELDLTPDPAATYAVAVSGPVETVGGSPAAAGPATETKTNKDAAPAPNPVGTALVYLISIAALVAVGYFVLQYYKGNKSAVDAKLEQLGVQVPKPDDANLTTAPAQPDPGYAKPAPVQKIVLDGTTPDPIVIPPSGAAPAVSSMQTGEPRLVSDTGDVIPLFDGETVVGREIGVGLSLPDESTISRRHAKLDRLGTGVTVSDLSSTNGTYVNGLRVTAGVTLRPGDAVQFGSVRFRFES